ncbi:MAG: radical SAM protein [Promethearchaeota archaeon]
MTYISSNYNFWIRFGESDTSYLFNSLQGGLLRIPKNIKNIVEELTNNCFELNDIPIHIKKIAKLLINGGFIVLENISELNIIKKRFFSPPNPKTFYLTIIPTLNCNLRCTYCYQRHLDISMSQEVCRAIIKEIKRRIKSQNIKVLKVEWYGGEPLLKLGLIKNLSRNIMNLVKENNIFYEASLVSNGTLLNSKTVKILSKICIKRIQITLDGLPEIHNLNRPYIDGTASFEDVIRGIKKASKRFIINLRINVDRYSIKKAFEFLDKMEKYGILKIKKNIRPYIAMIGPLTPNCLNTCERAIDPKDWYFYVLKFQQELCKRFSDINPKEIFEYPKIFQKPCGAISEWSVCVHPSGKIFNCGLEIDNLQLSGGFIWEPYWEHPIYKKWTKYNIFENEQCVICRYLPICMGGCPKHTFNKESFFKNNACKHWYNYLEPTIKKFIKIVE